MGIGLANHIPVFLTLIIVFEAIRSIPVYLSSVRNLPNSQFRSFTVRSVFASSILLVSAFVLVKFFAQPLGLRDGIYQIAIGVLLFAFSMSTMSGRSEYLLTIDVNAKDQPDDKAFAFAANSLATPGVMLTMLLLTDSHAGSFNDLAAIFILISLALLLTLVCLLNALKINKIIGKSGAKTFQQITAILFAFVAIDAVLRGLDASQIAKAATPTVAHSP
tara:strand:- start:349 stop:1005 length:657 start_codon:yes stop_codon:yes gene_type:complete